MNSGWIQFLIVALFVGSGFLNWVLQKAKEQRQIKKVQEERERRKRELLRTGRPMPEENEAVAPQGDLAARRQAQLRELRRQQEQRLRELRERAQRQQQVRQPGSQPTAVPASRVPPAAPTRSPPPAPSRVPTAAPRRLPTVQAPTRRAPAPPRAPGPLGTSPPVAPPRRRRPPTGAMPIATHAIDASMDDDHPTHRIVADAKRSPRPTLHPLAPQSPRDWRAAIIASEILARPLSEREPDA